MKKFSAEAWLAGIISIIGLLISVIGFFAIRTLNNVDESLKIVSSSVSELNVNMGKVITEQVNQRRDIDRHEIDLRDLKSRLQK